MLNVKRLVKDYNDSARGYNELLPWMCLWDEQTVATMDQGLLAVYAYDGLDAEGRTGDEVDAAVSSFERAFAGFTTGNTLWSIVDRRRTESYPAGRFEDPMSNYINEVWKRHVTGNQFQNFYSLAVHQRSAQGANAFFDAVDVIVKEENVSLGAALMRAGKAQMSMRARQTLDARRMHTSATNLLARCAELEQGMSRLGLRRLGGEELLAYLHARANPGSGARERFPMPRTPAFLNTLLANDMLERLPRSLRFTNDEQCHVGVVSLKGWPDEATFPGRLDALTNINGEVTIAHTFRFLDRAVAERAISDIERYNISKSVPFLHRILTSLSQEEPTKFNPGRLALAEDAKAALVDLYEGARIYGYHNLTVLCFGRTEEEMEEVRKEVHSALRDSGFTGHTERMHSLTAFTQTLPGQWGSSVRWANVCFGNSADVMPIRTLWAGPQECEHFTKELGRSEQPTLISLPTDSGVPFFWDPWTAGVGHTTIIGPTRAGKSVFVNFVLSQFRKYEPCRTVIFDKDYTCQVPTLLQDGEHYDLTPDASNALRLSPLALAEDPKHHPFLVRWIRMLIEMGRPSAKLTPAEIETVTAAVRGLANLPEQMRRVGYLRSSLGDSLGAYLDEWCEGGARGNWFDNPPSAFRLGRHVCFECKRLFDDSDVAVLAMDYLFYVVERQLDDTPCIIYTEETWFFLQRPEFVERLNDYIRTLGKRNAALWMTTQGLRELTASDTLRTMLDNIQNRIFLPNARVRNLQGMYEEVMGLNDAQLARIQFAEPKRDYYIVTPNMARMASVRLPPEIVAAVSSSSKARQTFARHYSARDTDRHWKRDYLKEMLRESDA